MTPEDLIDCFDEVARAVRAAVTPIDPMARRARTKVAGQYALDLVADEAALAVLRKVPVRVVSEESGVHEHAGATITVVLDPVDGSTNCARGISYWAISIGHTQFACNRSYRDGAALTASTTTSVEAAVVAVSGFPATKPAWKQFRALGCASLALCEVAAGGIDGYLDAAPHHAPWDYLGGYLACIEAGADVREANGDDLVTDDPKARRQVVAAGTSVLADALMPARRSPR